MDCVYHAYTDYMRYLGEQVGYTDLLYWKTLKWWTHGSKPQYTFGGVAPWIIDKLAGLHGYFVVAVCRIYTPAHYIEAARVNHPAHYKRMRAIIQKTNWWQDNNLYNYAGIYFLLANQHAIFSRTIPTYGIPNMQIFLVSWKPGG